MAIFELAQSFRPSQYITRPAYIHFRGSCDLLTPESPDSATSFLRPSFGPIGYSYPPRVHPVSIKCNVMFCHYAPCTGTHTVCRKVFRQTSNKLHCNHVSWFHILSKSEAVWSRTWAPNQQTLAKTFGHWGFDFVMHIASSYQCTATSQTL